MHAGFTRSHDMPHPRFFEKAISAGAYAGAILDESGYNRMLDDYYAAHGWDSATSWQTEACLQGLEMPLIIEKLATVGRLQN